MEGRAEYSELRAIFKALRAQCDTPAHKKQIEAIDHSMKKEDTIEKYNSLVAALKIFYHEVSRLNEQYPQVKHGAAFRTQSLKKIVKRYIWSHTTEEEVMQDKLTYDSLCTKLSAPIVTWENSVRNQGQNRETTNNTALPHVLHHRFGLGEKISMLQHSAILLAVLQFRPHPPLDVEIYVIRPQPHNNRA